MNEISKSFICWKPNPKANLRLFCFPFAGGGASFFRTWSCNINQNVEVYALRLPGRETQLREPTFTDLQRLIKKTAEDIFPYLDTPFAFFGHSMGALIGFELSRYLRKHYKKDPIYLFVSSFRAPHLRKTGELIYLLDDNEIISRLGKLNGTPEQVLNNDKIMKLLLPTIRADFKIAETYRYNEEEPLSCPISAFLGEKDTVSVEQMRLWNQHTSSQFQLKCFPGDHFYLKEAEKSLITVVWQQLRRRSISPKRHYS